MTRTWLDDLRPLGTLPPAEAARELRAIGEDEIADELDEAAYARGPAAYGTSRLRLRRDPVWRHTSYVIGHLAPRNGGASAVQHAGQIEADEQLRGRRLKVTLDRLRVADYPGRGMHHILFDFAVQNQTEQGPEPVHFNAGYRVAEGDHAAVSGRPVFTGLHVGGEGLLLQCATVNVKNESDEALLGFLDSDAFKTGLQLATTAQPALAPLSVMALSLTKAIAARNRNVTVQTIELGLDFSRISTRPAGRGQLPGGPGARADGAGLAVERLGIRRRRGNARPARRRESDRVQLPRPGYQPARLTNHRPF